MALESFTYTLTIQANKEFCALVLDAGCDGVIIPNIKNAKELMRLKDSIYYPPKGKRGVGFSRDTVTENSSPAAYVPVTSLREIFTISIGEPSTSDEYADSVSSNCEVTT